MESWQSPRLPRVPGTPVPLALYDTASETVKVSLPGETARMYVCGITPYDATHLGHAATMLIFDLVNRVWRDNGHDVVYAQNVTDVDEPLLERAERDGEDWIVLAMRETALFREDMEALRILPPAHYIGAVESMPEITELIGGLIEAGAGYTVEDGTGDVYFPVTASAEFGYESNYDRATMLEYFAERGGDPKREGKRDPLDALLWRGRREGEPYWPSAMGEGRPGWHIECAAIALTYLGETIDVQGGGSDLIFPHHEFSAAHAEVATGKRPFAGHYVHGGMIGWQGAKMSKSKGNLVFVSRLRADGHDPAAIRLGLLSGHYREDREWTPAILEAAEARLATWRAAAARPSGPSGEALVAELRARLADDLDAPGALAVVDAWAAAEGTDASAPDLVAGAVDALLGVGLR
ncbi:L-cysteine:1D-myo-inositol 2-amino-2-deoxy-alpha-D-glucopyranoside ligase [Actinorhabdospora filicis]|uniref:L-cysteine:1D-myo-inositol 2-amino-2-deoxy-alpha-D-glucopyranoside ligase n=1 Tax=Actinorhabdospora filicis TaxID=1785913 RepID=A0A9W6SLG1_9ACTN|nr:cysteine--1-D-myo-inosityl 2-amino-2-deoxy-alpha-D-glucopyranoside ligase [Actinorhabdospora filicis]GLZ79124.1 L-cysteine:1D-myo-inositol 2-amino-2-deoxy-alpha-D-glucopyranoside ligase [Actinorhabdospora filicis]